MVDGLPDDTFRPLAEMTRQSAAAMLWALDASQNDEPPVPDACTEAPFPDVPMDHPFCPHIRDGVAAHLIQGYADGTFRPTDPITRQTAAALLFRFPDGVWEVLGCDPPPFFDVTGSNPFCEEIHQLWQLEVVTGYEDGSFRPTQVVNRQHFVVMISRFTAYL